VNGQQPNITKETMTMQKDIPALTDIRGAVYIPARAYNAYQMWRDYSDSESRRDMGFAASVNLNALRIWASYDYWLEEPAGFKHKFDLLLDAASENGLRIMPSLFEDCGADNSKEALTNRSPLTAVAVKSPGRAIEQDERLWDGPKRFIEWFFDIYKDDSRLLAIEIMNEPHLKARNYKFAQAMLAHANQRRGRIALTMGCMRLEHNLYFIDHGLDICQFHDNFPRSEKEFTALLEEAKSIELLTGRPVWLTEWQRIRRAGPGWDVEKLERSEITPDLASLAPIIREVGVGNFLWSLMVKPAYLQAQRPNGTFNGIFHEDGSVYSLADARAVSGNPAFQAEEKQELPAWFAAESTRYQNLAEEDA